MNRTPRVALFTLVAMAVVWSAGIATATTAAAASNGVCPQVAGVKWVDPHPPHASGTVYDVSVGGKMTCAKAVGYVKKLVTRHVSTNKAFAGGPSGWNCKATASESGLAYFGSCNPKNETFLDPRDFIAWTVG